MMLNSDFQYHLDKSSKKFVCPSCSKKRFVRYVDSESGEYVSEKYGRCDREANCSYHSSPYSDHYLNSLYNPNWNKIKNSIHKKHKKDIFYFPEKVFLNTLKGYKQNTFIQNLLENVKYPFVIKDVERVISLYNIGSIQNGYRKGAVTFPFIDIKGNIRTIQVKEFDRLNHTKETDFLHSIIEKHYKNNNLDLPNWLKKYKSNDSKVSCLFGEHLLSKYKMNPIALVEAPKTAIYGSLYFGFPDNPNNLLWLAVYNLSSLNLKKCKVLKGRKVILFPDLSKNGNAFNIWKKKASEIQLELPNTSFITSSLLEEKGNLIDKEKGKDLADFLINQNWEDFRTIEEPRQQSVKSEDCETKKTQLFQENYQEESYNEVVEYSFENEFNEILDFFSKTKVPSDPIRLNHSSIITNPDKFINSHIDTLKGNLDNHHFYQYLNRLQQLKNIITHKN